MITFPRKQTLAAGLVLTALLVGCSSAKTEPKAVTTQPAAEHHPPLPTPGFTPPSATENNPPSK